MLKPLSPKSVRHAGFMVFLLATLFSKSCKRASKNFNENEVFRYNQHKNISSLDPAFSKDLADIWSTHQLFNGLVQMDDDMNVIPAIAKDWTIEENATIYRFTLRNDVYYHKHLLFGKDSTRTVNATDFEYSFNRIIDKTIASPGSWVFQKVQSFEAINDSVFQIKLNQPFPAFLGMLTMKYCSVVPKEIVEHYGNDFRSNPIGTGPFKFKRWEENIKLVFRKNHQYFEKDSIGRQLPFLEAVSTTFLPDKQSEFLQFVQGNLDFISGLDASYKDEILTVDGKLHDRYSKDVLMIQGPYLNTEYLAFFMESEKNEIQSELIRKAINIGFNRQKMIVYLRNGIGTPATGGFIPNGLPGHDSDLGYTYDPEEAVKLVKQYKTETNDQNPEITITTTSEYLSFCEYIQRELQKTGLTINVDVIPASALKEAKANGKLDLFRASWVADYPDAENYLSLYYSKNFAPNGPNYTHFNSATFDKWYEDSFVETDPVKRAEIYRKMDSLVLSTAPIVPLFYDKAIRFTRNNVKGLGINPTNLLELKTVRKN